MHQNYRPHSNAIFRNRIRVLLADMPPMLLEMITDTIAAQSDLRVVGNIGSEECLLNAIKRTNADLVVAGDGGLRREGYEELLHECPRLKVIELVGRNGHGLRYELCL